MRSQQGLQAGNGGGLVGVGVLEGGNLSAQCLQGSSMAASGSSVRLTAGQEDQHKDVTAPAVAFQQAAWQAPAAV